MTCISPAFTDPKDYVQMGQLIHINADSRRRSSGRLIALEGIQGSGKTALCKRLADMDYAHAVQSCLEGRVTSGLVWVSYKQPTVTSPETAVMMTVLSSQLWGYPPDQNSPNVIYAAYQTAWYTAHSEAVIAPLLSAGYDVLVDGWIGGPTAELLGGNLTAEQIDKCFAKIRTPDVSIMIDVDPFTAWKRIRDNQLGPRDSASGIGDQLTYTITQQQFRDRLGKIGKARGWTTLSVDTEESVDQTAERLTPLIDGLAESGTSVSD